jgi:formylglycine-generating enzyme required for sulfatase activity
MDAFVFRPASDLRRRGRPLRGGAPPTVELLNASDSTSAAFGARYDRDWEHLDGTDGWPTTAPVGSFQKGRTPQGVDDMAGNVWEWTATLDPDDGSRMIRGGSWGDREPSAFMVGAQRWNDPDKYVGLVGFRCAR